MREVKFRGKSLNTGMWVYGDLQHKGKRAFIEYEVDPATIGQHTGFTDKNAREVYEGDVLTDKFESIGVVEWQNGCFVVNFGDVDVFKSPTALMIHIRCGSSGIFMIIPN